MSVSVVEAGLLDSNFVAPVCYADVLVVCELNQFVIEGDFGDVRVNLDGVRLPQRTRYCEDSVGAAVAGKLVQVKSGNDEWVEIELLDGEPAAYGLIARKPDGELALQLFMRRF